MELFSGSDSRKRAKIGEDGRECYVSFVFFQAKDGIRDIGVTGFRRVLFRSSGRDEVFIETVGVGQAEIDIVDHADTVVLALMPGSGDSIQALKAGVMEIPDIIVVNKAADRKSVV